MSVAYLKRKVSVAVMLVMQLCVSPALCSQRPLTRKAVAAQNKPELVVQLGHSLIVSSVAFSPDGRYVVSAGGDNSAVIWEVETGIELRRFKHAIEVLSVAFSPDGRYVASVSADKSAVIWEVETGIELRRFKHATRVGSVAFSPNGKYILTGEDGGASRLWDIETRKEVHSFQGPLNFRGPNTAGSIFLSTHVYSVAFSRDGRNALMAWGDTAWLWDTETGAEVRRFLGHSDNVTEVAFSPDGKYVLTGSWDKTARLWDAETGKPVQRFEEHSDAINSVAFSPDGRHVLTVSDQTARLWEIGNGRNVQTLKGLSGSAAFSPDGRYVIGVTLPRQLSNDLAALSSMFYEGDKLGLWDVETGNELRRFEGYSAGVYLVAFSPNGKYILTGCGDGARLWEIETGKEVRSFRGYSGVTINFVLSPDFRYLLTGSLDQTSRLWEIESGRELWSLERKESEMFTSSAFSPDGRYMLIGCRDNTARLWDTATRAEVRRFSGHSDVVGSVEFSPDGRYVLTGSKDKTARIWDAETGKPLHRFEGHEIRSLAISPNGKYIATGSKTVKLWEIETERELPMLGEHLDWASDIRFSPNGRHVLTKDGSRVRLWEIETGRELQRFGEISNPFVRGSFTLSPDGRYLMMGSYEDKPARLWEIETGRELWRLGKHLGAGLIYSVAFSPDRKYVLTGGADTRLLDTSSGKELCRLVSLRDGNHLVVHQDGRFDTNNLEEIKGLHWIMPDDPMKPLPLEIFMRDYYEPRLLPRILNGEKFKEIRKLSELNRVQPPVNIVSVDRQGQSDLVTVTVEVAKAKSERQRVEKGGLRETGVYDLRLFRDGQIVGQYADGKPQALPQSASDNERLLAWRKENEVNLDANGKRTIKFEKIRLPQSTGKHEVQFTAYAFNEDRVKSETAKTDKAFTYEVAKEKAIKGRAYIISVGVNVYENPSFDLKYSVNDANAIQKTIFDRLSKTGDYAEIVQVPLISDYEVRLAGRTITSHEATKEELAAGQKIITSKSATKSNLKAVLDVLAGKRKPSELIDSVPNAEKLRKQLQQAQPEDLVLISFSCHGYADSNGNFFFVLYDTGGGTKREVTDQLLNRSLSSEELSLWLREVDAGEMLMIVDACHSAAAVVGKEFKPGPMGSRGLGQLSYDKRMRILTATQTDDVALGAGTLKQGLLTYALVKDGIESGKADFKPADKTITASEWLEYGESRVPKLYDEIMKGEIASDIKDLVQKRIEEIRRQRPSLFDFSRKKRDALIVRQ